MDFALSTHLFHGERLARRHLEAIRDAGFSDIEVFATRTHINYADDRAVEALAGLANELGLIVGSMHAPICDSFVGGQWGRAFSNASGNADKRQEAVAETTRALHACRALGCGLMVLHLGLPRGQSIPPDDNDRRAVQRSLEQIAEAAAGRDVELALEVIPNDLSRPDDLLDWLEGDLELGQAGVCLDFGHAHLMGGAPEAVEALAGHVITTHVHDNRGQQDDHLVPFAGTIDWTATLTAMWKIGYTGRLVFEVADAGGAAGVLQRTVGARTRLQAILKELAEPFEFKFE
jgi:sugar phosphate isomerase/epimerase